MIGWFKSLTFFNWLALIAFLFALISVSNAVLSLRSRFKDWRGVQNKKAFEKRLEELKTPVINIGKFRKEPNTYYFMIAHSIIAILSSAMLVAILFVLTSLFSSIPIPEAFPVFILMRLLGLLLLILTFSRAAKIVVLAHYTSQPDILKRQVSEFIENGVRKDVIAQSSVIGLIDILFKQNLITLSEQADLEVLAGEVSNPK